MSAPQPLNTESILSFVFTLTFIFMTFIVLRKSRSQANLLFALGSALFGIGTLFAGLGYVFHDNETFLWSVATAILILSPIGYFTSARQIITGIGLKNDNISLILIAIYSLLALLVFLLYPTQLSDQRIIIWDSLLALALILCVTQFYIIFKLSPKDLKLKLIVLMLGFLIAIVFLLLNVILTFSGTGSNILRYGLPLIGNLLVVLSFIAVPTQET